MKINSIGFVGGGRITRIILQGLKRAGRLPEKVYVTDTDPKALNGIVALFPEITGCPEGAAQFGPTDAVFLAVHPPVLLPVLEAAKPHLAPETIVCSLAPKITVKKVRETLGGVRDVCRMNPNAPSIVGAGFNPVYFPSSFLQEKKTAMLNLLGGLGQCPEVEEKKLEAFAVVSAMGPTYLWFQLYRLIDLGGQFGLTEAEALAAASHTAVGAGLTMKESGLAPAAVMDLIPVRPLAENEEEIKKIYETKLAAMYSKLTT